MKEALPGAVEQRKAGRKDDPEGIGAFVERAMNRGGVRTVLNPFLWVYASEI